SGGGWERGGTRRCKRCGPLAVLELEATTVKKKELRCVDMADRWPGLESRPRDPQRSRSDIRNDDTTAELREHPRCPAGSGAEAEPGKPVEQREPVHQCAEREKKLRSLLRRVERFR